MADLTFQSQQMAAQLGQHAQDQNIASVADMGAKIAQGADQVAKGLQIRGDRQERAIERADRKAQFEEQRTDRNAQFQQEMALNNRKLEIDQTQFDRRQGVFEQEMVLKREQWSQEKIRMQRLQEMAATEVELKKLELADRQKEHAALESIGIDTMREQEIEGRKLDLEMKRIGVEKARQSINPAPTPAKLAELFAENPEFQLQSGITILPDGSNRPLTDQERTALSAQASRRGAMLIIDQVVKSVGDFNPQAAAKIGMIGVQLQTGSITMEDAEKKIDAILGQHDVEVGPGGSAKDLRAAPGTAAAPASEEPKTTKVLGFDTSKIDPEYGESINYKVVGYIAQHADDFASEIAAAPGREGQKPSREKVIQDLVNAVGDTNNPLHAPLIGVLVGDGVIPVERYQQVQQKKKAKFDSSARQMKADSINMGSSW